MLRLVTYWPSRPAKGELLTLNWMAMVGSSMMMSGSGAGFSTLGDGFADGDAFDAGDGYDVAHDWSRSISVRLRPEKVKSLVMRVFCSEPSRLEMLTSSPAWSVPWKTRQMAMRPK